MFLIAFVLGVLITPLWYKLAVRFGKKNVWLFATVLLIISFLYTGHLSPNNADLVYLILLKVIQTLGLTCISAITPAMLSEIVDYSTWKFSIDRSATYFSFFAFMAKTVGAVGSGLGLLIVGWYGFDATSSDQTASGIQGLRLAIVWLPLLFISIALVFVSRLSITARRHAIIRRRLDARELRASHGIDLTLVR